jgi:glycosyltransferase involved in cell wall biosynthesis
MRIVVGTHHLGRVGGIETYVEAIVPAFERTGHRVALLGEVDAVDDRTRIRVPDGVQVWCAQRLGFARAVDEVRSFRPDLVYSQGISDVALEANIIQIAPAVLFAHAYYGTCVGGEKTFKFPRPSPCHRRFGWQCLAYYFPRRCGGLSPKTMWHEYLTQSRRQSLLFDYGAILTASEHMRREYVVNGVPRDQVHTVPLPIVGSGDLTTAAKQFEEAPDGAVSEIASSSETTELHDSHRGWHLLFAGRMMPLKGGAVFLDALPSVATGLNQPLQITFAGAGPARTEWEARARSLASEREDIRIQFTGWLARPEFDALLDTVDLLVIPSLWPEPFGLVGPEVGLHGVPAAGFAVGGIEEWLVENVNGFLAYDNPPTADGLARAIIKCLYDPERYQRLRRGARQAAMQFGMERHLNNLLSVMHVVSDNVGRTGKIRRLTVPQ